MYWKIWWKIKREPEYNIPLKNELIGKIKKNIEELEEDLKVVKNQKSQRTIKEIIQSYREQLKIAETTEYYVDIMEYIKLKKIT